MIVHESSAKANQADKLLFEEILVVVKCIESINMSSYMFKE